METYLAFGWNEPYNEYGLSTPIGGAGDFIGAAQDLETCREIVERSGRAVCHIASLSLTDLTQGLVVKWLYDGGEWFSGSYQFGTWGDYVNAHIAPGPGAYCGIAEIAREG